jgi:ABC-type phosphate transport system substrate-binding protein
MRGPRSAPYLCGLSLLLWLPLAVADLAVIVHPSNPRRAMSAQEVSDLYLGRVRSFGAYDQQGVLTAAIYEHPADSELRERFFRALNGMQIKQVNAYWARLRYSGEVLPPVSLADSREVLRIVGSDRRAIGYVDAALVSDAVSVVLRLKE